MKALIRLLRRRALQLAHAELNEGRRQLDGMYQRYERANEEQRRRLITLADTFHILYGATMDYEDHHDDFGECYADPCPYCRVHEDFEFEEYEENE